MGFLWDILSGIGWFFRKAFYKVKKKGGWTNSGHRLYGDHVKPENSWRSFQAGLKYQHFDDFKYWEFDVVESKDGVLYVFHDATKRKTIKRLCPTAPDHLKKKSIYELTAFQIDQLRLEGTDQYIPKFEQLMEWFESFPITVPIRVEIKKLLSTSAKREIIKRVKEHRDKTGHDIAFMMFKKKYRKVFKRDADDFQRWLREANLKLDFI